MVSCKATPADDAIEDRSLKDKPYICEACIMMSSDLSYSVPNAILIEIIESVILDADSPEILDNCATCIINGSISSSVKSHFVATVAIALPKSFISATGIVLTIFFNAVSSPAISAVVLPVPN